MIREPAVAGQFYPSNARQLAQEVDRCIQGSPPRLDATAVVAPHAGYMYSGGVAGAVYGAVRLPGSYIILGPNHTGRGQALALAPAGVWRTPLGLASIDVGLNERLLQECAQLKEDGAAHALEHALEVQLPFLQRNVAGVRFAAICVGTAEFSTLETLGHALARLVQSQGAPILLIASSDMNHYESAAIGQRKDSVAIERILALDPEGLFRVVLEQEISMCGFAPTVSVLVACRDLGAGRGTLIRYANSGDVSGDHEHVVGYAGIAIH
jgi:AmmeMemoRadiSam system protein B